MEADCPFVLAKRSIHIILLPFVLADVFIYFECWLLVGLAFAFGFILIFFFRDPERRISKGVCCAADGKIREVKDDGQHLFISTFMNVHNVHVNRIPISGTVKSIERVGGTLKPAFSGGASENSRVVTILDTDIGEVEIMQIAGIFAYRICPYIEVGQQVKKGDRLGIIRFGSRVDICLPSGKAVTNLEAGDKVKAGETMLATLVEAVE